MAAYSTLEAHDIVRFAEHYHERLVAAQAELALKRGLKAEKDWLNAAEEVLRVALEPTAGLLERARVLPELEEVRDEFAAVFQGLWADALEKLLAGVTFHAGPRDPIIEALFPHQKLAALRKADREGVAEYAKEFERRLRSSYLSRMLTQPNFAFMGPVLEQVAQALAKWKSAFEGEDVPEEQAGELRKELVGAARRLDLAVKQARLLAEAAFAPVPGAFEEQGLAAKPKKRVPREEKRAREEERAAEKAEEEAQGEPAAAEKPAEPEPRLEAKPEAAPAEPEKAKAVAPRKRKAQAEPQPS